jgi:selenocysteine lyase/cysteine desulfurase
VIDVDRLRRETPGVANVTHLNNAGASLMPAPVIDAVIDYLEHEARYGGYETREHLAAHVDDAYAGIGELLGVDPAGISLADNATRAWDMAFYGIPWREGDRVVTTSSEYASNLAAFLDVRDRVGVEIAVVPDTASGELDVEALASMLDERVALVAINHMPTNGGLVNPVAEVGAIAGEHGVPFLLDACQTVGQMPIDVNAIGCTMI